MPSKKRSTSLDVAKLAGVSRTTVSFVLNEVSSVSISDATRKRVFDAAKKLNYSPNIAGKKLVSGKSYTIGLVLCQSPEQIFTDAFLPQVILGVEQAAMQQGFHVLLKPVDPNDTGGYARLISENHVDGILLSGPREDDSALTRVSAPGVDIPIRVNSHVAKASLKILTGLIAPHQAAGFSGGRKSLTPGVAALETIAKQHSFPIRPYDPAMGWMKGNPFHEVAITVARTVGIDFIVNVVKNCRGEVVHAVAGHVEAAHEAGVAICEKSWVTTFPRKYDLVIVTPGGFPRDIDLHQAQKAMSTAELVAADGGVIVLIAECADGIGKFAAWLKGAKSPHDVIERFKREGFTREHSSKAFMCARALAKHPVVVSCSGISQQDMEAMFFRYAQSPQEAVDEAVKLKGGDPSVLVLPYAVDCVPKIVAS